MKAEELFVGALVRVNRDGLCIKKDTIVEVRAVDADNKLIEKGFIGSAHCRPLDDNQFDGGIWCEYLDPIPLTQEILEKNGFEKQQRGHFGYENEDESLSMAFYPKKMNYTKGAYNYIDIDRGCMRIQEMPIDYVHEFQHALSLCGIEKEIEL